MKTRKLTKNALAMSAAWALAFGLTPDSHGVVWAAPKEQEQPQENAATIAEDGSSVPEYALEAITVQAKRPDWESKLSPGTVTIIRPDDYKGEQKSLPELLKDVPGVHVREVNGKGQYTTVSVRGSTAAQVGVFIDGVLFNLGGDAAADISTIPVKNVERIEVYRGYIPARFGGTYMGGVINIVTKKPKQENVAASYGQRSWGGYTGSVQVDAPLGRGSLLVGLNRDQSEGDFRYRNTTSDYEYAKNMPQLQESLVSYLNAMNTDLQSLGITTPFNNLEEAQSAYKNPAQYAQLLTTAQNNYYQYWGYATKADFINDMGWTEQRYLEEAKSSFDGILINAEHNIAYTKLRMSMLSADSLRYRRNNDYKNTDAIIKWQDEHWTAKATWKQIDRHLPWGLWTGGGGDPNGDMDLTGIGLYNSPRHQQLTATELLLGHRDTLGNLEWGWNINYLDQSKRYRNEGYGISDLGAAYWNQPLSVWSRYDSRRIGGAFDGSYKAGSRHLLELMANWSLEKMDVDGWGMTDFKDGDIDYRRRFRNYFEQTLLNLQVQDTITLNQSGDLWFTPSVRYNASTVLGRSSRLKQDQHRWFNMEDEQTNSKVTWQAALKKKVNDKLTLRSTVGSYYRLLNLYEIAGDGAGILPRPVTDRRVGKPTAAFPLPEEGTQWDISAIWDDRLLGADANIQLTYFGRKSENLLQLYRFGYDYFSYSNAGKAQINGVELQTNLKWRKWDMNLAATYMHANHQRQDNSPTGDKVYNELPLSFTPEWEGSLRLTYHPDAKTAIFSELKYVDQMYVSQDWSTLQTALTTVGLGVKHLFNPDWQLTVGVNDLFNRGPALRLLDSGLDSSGKPMPDYVVPLPYAKNTDCPTQGRTYYLTLQYRY